MNTVKAIYPGSFDPLTNGHLDLIARGSKIFDHLVVAILRNSHKNPLFNVEERVQMLTEGLAGLNNVSIATFDGLLVDFARQENAQAVMRGIRAIHDAGLTVPGDISVVGFDDIISAAYQKPSLTTVRQPLRQMGSEGAQILLDLISHPKKDQPTEIVMQPELIVRESTGPAPKTKTAHR